MSAQQPTVPAGWYPDPQGGQQARYWDGSAWTPHVAPFPAANPPSAPGAGQYYQDGQSSQGSTSPMGGQDPYAPSTQQYPGGQQNFSQPAQYPAQSGYGAPGTGFYTSDAVSPGSAGPGPVAPRKRRRGLVAALVTVAIVLGMVVVGGGYAYWRANSGDSIDKTLQEEGIVQGKYAWTKPLLDIPRDHEFEIPAKYDLDAVNNSHVTGEESKKVFKEWAIQVFYDPALTKRAATFIYQANAEEPIQLSASENSSVSLLNLGSQKKKKSSLNHDWGLHDQYYIVQRVDENGKELPKPKVTKFTVKTELTAPVVEFAANAKNGALKASWNKVPGATKYTIVLTDFNMSVPYSKKLGETDKTSWESTSSDDDNKYSSSDEPWASRQNRELKLYEGASAADLRSGLTSNRVSAEKISKDIMVFASNADTYSPSRYFSPTDLVATLPYEIATGVYRQQLRDVMTGYSVKITDLPTSIPYTSLDGSMRTATAQIDAAHIESKYSSYWRVPVLAQGTRLGAWAEVDRASTPDIKSAVAAFNKRAQLAGPKTGAGSDAEVLTVGDSLKGMKTAPPTKYPVYGSSPMVKYIGQHMIGHSEVIDLSEYVNQPGAPGVEDAVREARYQNPYALEIDGMGISSSGTALQLRYTLSKLEMQRLQAQLKAKADQVISSTIKPGMSEPDKVTALNNWLTKNADYDDDAFTSIKATGKIMPRFEYASSAEGVLMRGKGVCASYAAAFNLLANQAGIKSVVVSGDVRDGGAHAWNKVNVNGHWRAVDVTWNDSPQGNRFLMIKDSQFTGSATRKENNYWMTDSLISQYATN